MFFSPPTLHRPVISKSEHRDHVRSRLAALAAARPQPTAIHPDAAMPVAINLTTVSLASNFDAYIDVQFPGSNGKPIGGAHLLVDSGHPNMIVPDASIFKNDPAYTVLGTVKEEPWGCPAQVIEGPFRLRTTAGTFYEVGGCVFYACTGPNGEGERTANFGTGRVSPWSANSWNNPPLPKKVTMQSPLSYTNSHPYAEFVYAPAQEVLGMADKVVVNDKSLMILHPRLPAAFTMMDIIKDCAFMSVVPNALAVGGVLTGWPGGISSPIAMIDTGGGPVLLSDPTDYVYSKTWPHEASCPDWAKKPPNANCNCIADALRVGLQSAGGKPGYVYSIDTSTLPKSVQGLTAVMCKVNEFMRDKQGMNVGGITALFNRILINYPGAQVGFASK